jgi:RNA polymerase sigma-70 factor (ECF subfamily)
MTPHFALDAPGVATRRAHLHTARSMSAPPDPSSVATSANSVAVSVATTVAVNSVATTVVENSDEALMLSYAAGRAAAFDTLYARHKGGVYRYLLRHCGNAGTADELFQDVWMNAIRARDRYVPTAKFTTWLYTLAHHRLVDHWRASGQVKFASIDDDGDETTRATVDALPAARREEPDARLDARQQGAQLRAALAMLPAAQRDAFLLQQEGGLSLVEIAELTGVGLETVKSRLRYAVAKLRLELWQLRSQLGAPPRSPPGSSLREQFR